MHMCCNELLEMTVGELKFLGRTSKWEQREEFQNETKKRMRKQDFLISI